MVRTAASLASVGTEKGMMELARKSLVGKARARPDLVRQVIDKFRTEGIAETWRQVMGRLDTPVTLGYSSAGTVVEVGADVTEFAGGDRVACAGSGFAGHIQVTSVPVNLLTKMPDSVSFDEGSFVAIGGIALEAVRMARVGLGDRVVVIGLGLLGQVAVQLLKAAGCHVFGVDVSESKSELALQAGADRTSIETDPKALVDGVVSWSGGHGADAVIILASTSSNEPLERAAEMSRERGRVVATGLVGLEVPRRTFYEKELELVVSRAWGPGLYDDEYANGNIDYPLPYARWTANRNMAEFIDQVGDGNVKVDYLITHKFPIDEAVGAYEMILNGTEPYIGVVLNYPKVEVSPSSDVSSLDTTSVQRGDVVWLNSANTRPARDGDGMGLGMIGAGLYASGTLLPVIKGMKNVHLRGVGSRSGFSGRHAAEKYGFDYCTTSPEELIADEDVDLLMVLTRHGSHGHLTSQALRAGKHVFVEKPLALNPRQLREVAEAYGTAKSEALSNGKTPPIVMVGFNRRYSPLAVWLKDRLRLLAEPVVVNCIVNAGAVPIDSWVNDPEQGGGRIVGEVCHFIDLVSFLTSSTPTRVHVEKVGGDLDPSDDSVVATVTLGNGSLATISYLARGDKRYPRERVEVFGGGAVGLIDNFRSASFQRNGRVEKKKSRTSVDRGHRAEIESLLSAIQGQANLLPDFDEYISTTLTTFAMVRSLTTGLAESPDYEGLVRGELARSNDQIGSR